MELLAAARALFVEQGYEAVSIRKITQRAGCPVMTFYVYFRSKRELIRHIWDDILQLVFDAATEASRRETQPEARLKAFFLTFIQYFLNNPDNYRIVFFHEDRLASAEDTYYADSSQVIRRLDVARQAIIDGVEAGDFAPTDPQAACEVLQTLCVGVTHCLIAIPEIRWSAGLPETAVDQAIAGLRTGASKRSRQP